MSFIFRRTNRCISSSYVNSNLGLLGNFELLIKMWKYSFLIQSTITELSKLFIKSVFVFFIKSFLFIFSSKTSFSGTYTLINNQPENVKINKYITYRVLYIPIFYTFTRKLNDNDWEFISSKN
jgi:hypothetical protein